MEFIYRVFLLILPTAIVLIAYIWLFRKILAHKKLPTRIIALVLLTGGTIYAIYDAIDRFEATWYDGLFNFTIILVSIVVMFLISLVLAIGEPGK